MVLKVPAVWLGERLSTRPRHLPVAGGGFDLDAADLEALRAKLSAQIPRCSELARQNTPAVAGQHRLRQARTPVQDDMDTLEAVPRTPLVELLQARFTVEGDRDVGLELAREFHHLCCTRASLAA